MLNAEILSHADLEERLLIPALKPHLENDRLLIAMCDEHVEMDRSLETVEDAQDIEEAVHLISHCVGFAREHFEKEEKALFPAAEEILGHEASAKLGQAWAETRGVSLD